jgi:hypothetical protein
MSNAIGKISATLKKPSTCEEFNFWIKDNIIVAPFDFVKVPHVNNSYTYAIIQDLHYSTDCPDHLSGYVSSDFGNLDAPISNERLGTTIAKAKMLFNTKDIEMPIKDGAIVEWADVEGIRRALGIEDLDNDNPNSIPSGWIEMVYPQSVRHFSLENQV